MNEILQSLREFNVYSMMLRVILAMFMGGIVGFERERKRRPAGFRTYMLVALGAAMTIMLSEYLDAMLSTVWYDTYQRIGIKTDVSRFGAQVINGVGFLGAGTIIVTSRQEIKGLTTAAGLWASACMGLAIGAGFYLGAVLGCVLIFISITFMRRIEGFILARARNMNIYVELVDINDIGLVIDMVKSSGIRIYDIEINKASPYVGAYASAVFSMRLPEKQPHSEIIAKLASIKTIRSLEEI